MNILLRFYRWIADNIFIPPIPVEGDYQIATKQEEPKPQPIVLVKQLIENYPQFGQPIILYTPHLGLGNYALFLGNDLPIIKIQLNRVSKSYVLISILDRETLWDIKQNIIYTDDPYDVNYWLHSTDIQTRPCSEFVIEVNEVICCD